MSLAQAIVRARYRWIPDQLLGEILLKPWIDTAIPALALFTVVCVFGSVLPDFLSIPNAADTARQVGEIAFVTLGLTIVMLAGGIDLSVGAIFGLCNFWSIALVQGLKLPALVAAPVAVVTGGLLGLINGWLIGFMGLRAFLTTLATLIIGRAALATLALNYTDAVITDPGGLEVWNFIGAGSVLGVPFSFVLLLIACIAAHLFLTRMKFGWHLQAIGGSRRSAFNAGLNVRWIICLGYVLSGMCCGMAGFLYAARVVNPGAEVGAGTEIVVLTAAVLGGVSLGGGRGSVSKAVLGTVIVILITNSMVALGLRSGATNLVLGAVLLAAVIIDVRWIKNRHKLLSRVYVAPTYYKPGALPSTREGSGPLAVNNALSRAEILGLGELDGPEDVIFDSQGNLYTGSRHGEVIRFHAPDYKHPEVFAHIGGATLGFAIDAQDTLHVCVSGMGLYAVDQARNVKKLSDQTPRSLLSIRDDSRVRFADDLDIAPDGRVFFSEATVRFDITDWASDSIEMRPNGRILCYDPQSGKTSVVLKNLVFPNGICVETGGKSLLFSETWACRVRRFYFDGPRKGQVESVLENLPGFTDNINRASDGNYWIALLGMRTPVHDLSMEMPGFRKRMARRVAFDEWLYPNFNAGVVLKFTPEGRILYSLWDGEATNFPTLTSMREHRGYLYLGGVFNNRIGRIKLDDARPEWTAWEAYWGTAQ